MQRRTVVGLAFGLVLTLLQEGSVPAQLPTGFVGALTVSSNSPTFGGFSAIEVAWDGSSFLALSDRGAFVEGRMVRDATGRLTAVDFGPVTDLKGPMGTDLFGNDADSEGLALAADGTVFVSFEMNIRIVRYDRIDGTATALPDNPDFAALPLNGALEALAVDADDTLFAVPERPARSTTTPVYVLRDGIWQPPLGLPQPDLFRPVAADFGPDGRFYLLERRFYGLRGFSSRIRRFDLGIDGFSPGMTLLQTLPGLHDNLEGLSIWRAPDGLRATMISDDNFIALQRTEIVEYRLPD